MKVYWWTLTPVFVGKGVLPTIFNIQMWLLVSALLCFITCCTCLILIYNSPRKILNVSVTYVLRYFDQIVADYVLNQADPIYGTTHAFYDPYDFNFSQHD